MSEVMRVTRELDKAGEAVAAGWMTMEDAEAHVDAMIGEFPRSLQLPLWQYWGAALKSGRKKAPSARKGR